MNLEQVWTVEIVEEWICIAAQVERVLPRVAPKMSSVHLPIIKDWQEQLWDLLRDEDDKPKPRFQPTNEQVSMWEQVVLRWLPLVDSKKDMKILWWRGCDMSWNRIGKKLDIERHTVANRHKRVLEDLTKALNRRK